MSTDDSIRYGDSLAFLVSQVGARSAELFAGRLQGLGITPRQFAILSHLAHGRPKSQQQLADLLGMHRNNMVGLIDEMEAVGFVERVRGAADRRVFEIHPTRLGLATVRKINAVTAELDGELAGHLSATERGQLIELLRGVADHLGLALAVHPSVAGRRRN